MRISMLHHHIFKKQAKDIIMDVHNSFKVLHFTRLVDQYAAICVCLNSTYCLVIPPKKKSDSIEHRGKKYFLIYLFYFFDIFSPSLSFNQS